MRVKLYRAARMADAMAVIRDELGEEALIVATRRIAGGVEVTAAIDAAEPKPAPPAAARPPPPPPRLPAHDTALAFHAVPTALREKLARGPLPSALAATLRFEALAALPAHVPLLLAGPPGAGKTVTTARLATRLVMAGVRPAVFTADGQRAGGAEQLGAFTRLLGLALTQADHPADLRRALIGPLATFGRAGPVLIDLPGSNPYAPDEAAELAAFAEAAGGRLVLVLPAGLDPAEASDLAHAYRAAGATHLVTTRLDLARRLGCVLAAAAAGLAIAEASDSPGVADGLIDLTPARLALLLSRTPDSHAWTENAHG